MCRFVALWLLGSVAACDQDVQFRQTLPPGSVQNALLEIEPSSHDFGSLTSRDEETVTFAVTNRGYATLFIDDLTFDGDPSFALAADGAYPIALAPEEVWTFDATFQPRAGGEMEALVTLWSTDGDRPELQVPLRGDGALPQLEITPDPVDFRTISVPCRQERVVTLTNRGPEPLRIQRAALDDPDAAGLALEGSIPVDLSLAENQSFDLRVSLQADIAQSFLGSLTVESTDPRGPQSVDVVGTSRFVQTSETRYVVPPPESPRFVFAIDQSGSMNNVQTQLIANFTSFVNTLASLDSDWRLAVVTGEGSPYGDCFIGGGWLNPTSPSLASEFTTRVRAGNDSSLYTEALMALVDGALGSRSNPGQCNHGFLSGVGPLHIVVISDERDQSPDQNAGGYLTRWRNAAGAGQPMRVHAIVDLTSGDNDCAGSPDGPGIYLPAAQQSGGMAFHICHANWAQALAQIAQSAVVDRRSVALSDQNPHPPSVEVTIDGVPQPSGWSYDPSRNAVDFDEPLEDGEEVVISYGLAPNCP